MMLCDYGPGFTCPCGKGNNCIEIFPSMWEVQSGHSCSHFVTSIHPDWEYNINMYSFSTMEVGNTHKSTVSFFFKETKYCYRQFALFSVIALTVFKMCGGNNLFYVCSCVPLHKNLKCSLSETDNSDAQKRIFCHKEYNLPMIQIHDLHEH